MQVCTRACTNAHLGCGVAASLITHLRKNSAARLEYADLHAPAGLYRKVMLAIAPATNGDIVDLGMQANAVTNVLRQNIYDEQDYNYYTALQASLLRHAYKHAYVDLYRHMRRHTCHDLWPFGSYCR